jgi:uncharacterized protein (TIRG00374 family)
MSRKSSERPAPSWRTWFFSALLLAALVAAVLHWGEIEQFASLLRRAEPGWMIVAVVLQLSTYASVATGWAAVLRRAGSPRPITPLVRIAVTKLFADQVLPSAGMGGNVLLVDQLCRLGIDRGAAAAALLMSVLGYYIAYALFAGTALLMLWLHDQATPLMAGLFTLFLAVAIAIPALALWLRNRGSRPLSPWIEKIGAVRAIVETVGQAPKFLLSDRILLVRVTLCNALVFLADAGTLFACLHALGQETAFGTAFIALIVSSIVVTLGPIPLGLGSFEATSTGMLRLLGVPIAAAFAATLLLRLMILWLPMLPGALMIRTAVRSREHGKSDVGDT